MIRACFLVKYPPIQGGVSRQSYWLAREMAERGNQIYVVTNADEVEDEYRMYMDDSDDKWYAPQFDASGGFVKVRSTYKQGKNLFHIPYTNPYVTKLASIATQVIRRNKCQVIFAYYLQPYGIAAYLASQWTGVPFILRHAGSDLGRLMKQPDLTIAYREILKAAGCVWTGLNEIDTFRAMGVKDKNIWSGRTPLVPPIFNPETPAINLNELLIKLDSDKSDHVQNILSNRKMIDISKPTIGIYGKCGEFKGSFDLLIALSSLKDKGLDFNLIAFTQGRDFSNFRDAIARFRLQDVAWTFPFIPHWRIPGVIRSCTAICFLERDFPISFHGPGIPMEILSCGTCLILSGEILDKQRKFMDKINDKENILIVDDPRNHNELADKLRFIIENPQAAKIIGHNGNKLLGFRKQPRFNSLSCVEEFENQLKLVIERHNYVDVASGIQYALTIEEKEKQLGDRLPVIKLLLVDYWYTILKLFFDHNRKVEENSFNNAFNFCCFLETQVDNIPNKPDFFTDIIRYQKCCSFLYTDYQRQNKLTLAHSSSNVSLQNQIINSTLKLKLIQNLSINNNDWLSLFPVKANGVHAQKFSYDVPSLIDSIRRGDLLDQFPKTQKFFLFKKELNFIGIKLEVSEGIQKLLELCDGKQTLRQIIAEFTREMGKIEPPDSNIILETEIVQSLQSLSAKGIILWFKDI